MESKIIQVRGRGTITLPKAFRDRYGLAEGDPLTVLDLDGVLILAPRVDLVARLASEIEELRHKAHLEVDDLLEGLTEQRKRYVKERLGRH